jgi:hypothetical protein
MSARRGHLIAEVLCALALAGLLAVACATSLLHARRLIAAAEQRARAERAGLEALQVVAAIARDADSIVVLGDTAVELHTRIADGVACARDGAALLLPPVRTASGSALAAMAMPIEPGDEVRAWVEDTLTGYRAWLAAAVDSVTTRTGESPCGSAGGLVAAADAAETRLRLVASGLDGRIGAGTPVRVGRRGRVALYNVGGGQWMLGWRRCLGGTCGVVQPVAGPLRSPAAGGFGVRLLAAGRLEVAVGVPGVSGSMTSLVVRTDAGR